MYFCLAEGRAPINMKIQKLRPQGQGYKDGQVYVCVNLATLVSFVCFFAELRNVAKQTKKTAQANQP